MKKYPVLITDLDNTLYNWVDYFAPCFRAMVHFLSKETETEKETIVEDFRRVYKEHENIEFSFSVQELQTLKKLPSKKIDEAVKGARAVFVRTGRKYLSPYNGVRETLLWAYKGGVKIFCCTNAPINLAQFRLRQLHLSRYFSGFVGRLPPSNTLSRSKNKIYYPLEPQLLKPSIFGYKAILESFGNSTLDVYVVGDSYEKDLIPALSIGAKGIFARYGRECNQNNIDTIRKISTKGGNQKRDLDELEFDERIIIIDSFSEILNIIKNTPQPKFPGF